MSSGRLLFLVGFATVLIGTAAYSILVVKRAVSATDPVALGPALARFARRRPGMAAGGRWAFVAHRIGGFAIFAFLILHIVDVGLFAISGELYDDVHGLFGSVALRVFECGLLFAILFHTLNGLRLIVLDITDASQRLSSGLLRIVVAVTVVAGSAGSAVIMAPVVT